MISSPEINTALRKNLSPVLRENGFSSVQARKAWGWHDHCIWVLKIRAVGGYFSLITGWPPMSVFVWTGVYYDFMPQEFPSIPVDAKGRLCPDEAVCHVRSHLEPNLNQQLYQSQLRNRAERERNDIWWIAPNGENTAKVVEDIAHSYMTQGLAWFNYHTALQNVFSDIESGGDCYNKFYQATYFARQLGYETKYQEYLKRLNQEKERRGRI